MDKAKFYDVVRPELKLTLANVAGFERVLDEGLRRRLATDLMAYILATAWWETGKTMQPVKEAYWLSEDWRRKNLRYFPYYGRGKVQLTWKENYQKASSLYGVDFVANPDLALEDKWSTSILFDGTLNGWFTGKALDDYIDDRDDPDDVQLREYMQARRVVNGVDKARTIAELALLFERGLRAGGWGMAQPNFPPVDAPRPSPAPIPPVPVEPAPPANVPPAPSIPAPAPVPVPAPSPIEQSSKAVGAAKWAGIATGFWTMLVAAQVLPEQFMTPEFTSALTGFIATTAAAIGAYRAAPNAQV